MAAQTSSSSKQGSRRGPRSGCYDGRMTRLLEEAFRRASELPEPEQDLIARHLLDDLESERRWNELFAASQDVLQQLAAQAKAEEDAGLTRPLTDGDFALEDD